MQSCKELADPDRRDRGVRRILWRITRTNALEEHLGWAAAVMRDLGWALRLLRGSLHRADEAGAGPLVCRAVDLATFECRENGWCLERCYREYVEHVRLDRLEIAMDALGAAEVGAAEVGAAEVGAAEVGAAEVGAAEVGATEVGAFATLTSPPLRVFFKSYLKNVWCHHSSCLATSAALKMVPW